MPLTDPLTSLTALIESLEPVQDIGRVVAVKAGVVEITGLSGQAHIGDRVLIHRDNGIALTGEILQLSGDVVTALPDANLTGVALGTRVALRGPAQIAPSDSWIGRIVDPDGHPLDGKPLLPGPKPRPLRASPPGPATRRPLGARLETGIAAFNTLLPIVEGQRIGLFAGSGVGKSSLLGKLAAGMQADVVVIALIGERGRELRHFTEEVLGSEGLQRAVVVAATSDQSPLQRRRCAWSAMAVAEHFREQGQNVLFLADSITRFAEAHREVAVAAGEAPVLRGFPPSTAHMMMSLCERAGPGADNQGDITGVFSVLVAGSDMDEPIADMLRGVLDGHVVLDRSIAERGRYPAIDVLQSVSRSLPAAATEAENRLLLQARKLLGLYEMNAMMIRAGLYAQGSDPEIDQAITLWSELEDFLARDDGQTCAHSFQQLELILRRAKSQTRAVPPPHPDVVA